MSATNVANSALTLFSSGEPSNGVDCEAFGDAREQQSMGMVSGSSRPTILASVPNSKGSPCEVPIALLSLQYLFLSQISR